MTPIVAIMLGHAATAAAFAALAILATSIPLRRARRSNERSNGGATPWSVLRPVESMDDALVARFADEARRIAPARMLVCVATAPSVEQRAALSRANVVVVVDARDDDVAANRKLLHLAAGARALAAHGESGSDQRAVLVSVDGDVLLERADLDALRTTLEEGGPDDIAFAVPAPTNERTWGALSLRGILRYSPQSFAVVDALARLTGGAPAVAGKCVAIRAATLARLGGYEASSRAVADDVALMERVVALGATAHRSPRAVAIDARDVALRAVVARMVRWLRVIRGQRARLLFAYPLVVAPLPLLGAWCGLAFALRAPDAPMVAAAFALVWLARTFLGAALARGPFRDHPTRWLELAVAPFVGDVVLSIALVGALLARNITWMGRIYAVDRRGLITGVRRSSS